MNASNTSDNFDLFEDEWQLEDEKQGAYVKNAIPDGTYNVLIKSGKLWPASDKGPTSVSLVVEFPKLGNQREFWRLSVGHKNDQVRRIAKRQLKTLFPYVKNAGELEKAVSDFDPIEAQMELKTKGQYQNYYLKNVVKNTNKSVKSGDDWTNGVFTT